MTFVLIRAKAEDKDFQRLL